MPWQCRMVERRQDAKQTGDMWYDDTKPDVVAMLADEMGLSDEFKRDWLGKRSPLYVRLPNGAEMCLDRPATGAGNSGWTITGTASNITVKPSINDLPGKTYGWHGWITDGIMTDDIEGRTYNES